MHLGGTRLRPAIAGTILLFLAACSGPQPIEPSPTSAAPTPTVAAPAMPDQAQENTPEGAAAFVKHYIDVFNYASNTGNTTELRKLTAPSCSGCHSYIDLYEKTYKAGGYFKDSDWKLGELKLDFNKSQSIVYGSATSPAGIIRDRSGTEPRAGIPEDSDLTFIVSKRPSSSWSLITLELQATS